MAQWGVWSDHLEYINQGPCILWHGHRKRRIDGITTPHRSVGCMKRLLGKNQPRPVYIRTWRQKIEGGRYYNTTSLSGVYAAVTWNTSTKARVYWDMTTENRGWTVLQHHMAQWGVCSGHLEYINQGPCILGHDNRRRRIDGITTPHRSVGCMQRSLGIHQPRPMYTGTWTQKKEVGWWYNTTWLRGMFEVITWKESTKARVYCDMDTEKGGWTVLQHHGLRTQVTRQEYKSIRQMTRSPATNGRPRIQSSICCCFIKWNWV